MQKNTLTSIEKLKPGDLFTKQGGGYVYIVIDVARIVKNKKLFGGSIRRIDQDKKILFRLNVPVIFLENQKNAI